MSSSGLNGLSGSEHFETFSMATFTAEKYFSLVLVCRLQIFSEDVFFFCLIYIENKICF